MCPHSEATALGAADHPSRLSTGGAGDVGDGDGEVDVENGGFLDAHDAVGGRDDWDGGFVVHEGGDVAGAKAQDEAPIRL